MRLFKIFIIIPTFNEGPTLQTVLEDLERLFAKMNPQVRLVVVDDGSTDQTRQVLDEKQREGGIVLLRHEKNLGVGRALETGFTWVLENADEADLAAVMEADGTNDATLVENMAELLMEGNDVVIGSRLIPGGRMKGFPLHRRLLSWAGNRVMQWTMGVPGVSDYTIFFRGYRVGVLKKMAGQAGGAPLIKEKSFAANAEILLRIVSQGGKVAELPHVYRYDQKKSSSKIRLGKTIAGYLGLIRRFREPVRQALHNRHGAD